LLSGSDAPIFFLETPTKETNMAYALKDLNKAAAAHDLELVKGDNYFYWVHPERVDIPSVYISAFNHADRKFWEAELVKAAAINSQALAIRA
jgi:hypothetical protein